MTTNNHSQLLSLCVRADFSHSFAWPQPDYAPQKPQRNDGVVHLYRLLEGDADPLTIPPPPMPRPASASAVNR